MPTNNGSSDISAWWAGVAAKAPKLLPVALELCALVVVVVIVNWLWKRKESANPDRRTLRLLGVSLLTVLGFVVILFLQPGLKNSIGDVVTLAGILLSAAIALSSTTFISNFMAGIMLARVCHFRAGDFLNVGEHFGRVSEIGLLHTEIQTEDSNLTTFPNLFLVTNPCKVVRRSKTVISATVSLGYDVPHTDVKELLIKAAGEVPLKDPFVRILELGDFSVTYQAAGVLENVKQLLSTRSKLQEHMLDALHGAGIEIVSPTFMYTRTLSTSEQVLSPAQDPIQETGDQEPEPESVIFDKADEAESIDNLRTRREKFLEEIEAMKKQLKEATLEEDKGTLKREIRWRETSIAYLEKRIEAADGADS